MPNKRPNPTSSVESAQADLVARFQARAAEALKDPKTKPGSEAWKDVHRAVELVERTLSRTRTRAAARGISREI